MVVYFTGVLSVEYQNILVPAISGLIGVISSTFWLQKWITKTDVLLDDVRKRLENIRVDLAVQTNRFDEMRIQYREIEKRITKLEEKIRCKH